MAEVISASELTKSYGDTLAVDHASFSVKSGEIFGFLGLNGAGKTTTIKMLTTLIAPTFGGAKVLGYDISKEGLEIRKRLGVVQQQESYDRNLTVQSSLRLYASIWGLSGEEASRRIKWLYEKFELGDTKKKKIRWLSFGQRRRLQVAREFLHDSSLLILDEPTIGMDVLARHIFLDYIRERARSGGQTIFYTTHIISEAEYLCDRVAVIHRGKIVALDTPKELKKKYADVKSVSVVLRNSSELEKVSTLIEGLENVQRRDVIENELRLVSQDPFKLASDVSTLLGREGYDAESISIAEPSLEQVIVRLVGEKQ
ncbi:MAG: ABC transporter ATP-binding protein [Nitrososphaerales archaeon]